MQNIRRFVGRKKAASKNSTIHNDEASSSSAVRTQIYNEHDQQAPRTSTDNIVFRGSLASVHKVYTVLSGNPQLNVLLINTGLIRFLLMKHANSDRQFVSAIVERWSTNTHTFQFPQIEIGFTPFDFTTLTGISVGSGLTLPVYHDPAKTLMHTTTNRLLPGFLQAGRVLQNGAIFLTQLERYIRDLYATQNEENHAVIVRAFVLYMVGALWFPTANSKVNVGWLYYLEDIDGIQYLDWGSAILARIYISLNGWKEGRMENINWIWSAFFGMPGSCNDINVLHRSTVFHDLLHGKSLKIPYTINNHTYKHGYYLADGIYPPYATIVQAVRTPITRKERFFKTNQESVRKDVERAFGILQARWGFIRQPARLWNKDKINMVMKTCIVLHNMIVEDELRCSDWDYEYEQYLEENEGEEGDEEDSQNVGHVAIELGESSRTQQDQLLEGLIILRDPTNDFRNMLDRDKELRDREIHHQLQNDLIEHNWRIYSETI